MVNLCKRPCTIAWYHQLALLEKLQTVEERQWYIQQRHVYDGQHKAAGLSNMHGLRHRYAQTRYKVLTGWKALTAGGPSVWDLSPTQRMEDSHIHQAISRELGHHAHSVVAGDQWYGGHRRVSRRAVSRCRPGSSRKIRAKPWASRRSTPRSLASWNGTRYYARRSMPSWPTWKETPNEQ